MISAGHTVDKRGVATLVLVLCLAVPTSAAAALPAAAATSDAGAAPADVTASDVPRVSIENIQRPDSGTASPYAGQDVLTFGTVTAVGESGFHIQKGTGPYSGVYVYTGGDHDVSTGDVVLVEGLVKEFNGLTEIDVTGGGRTIDLGTDPVPEPTTVTSSEASSEAYEGVLVRVEDLTVTATPGDFGEWAVDDGSGSVAVDDVAPGDDTVPEETGGTIDAIEGPVFYSFGAFKIQPTAVENLQPPEDDDGGDGDGPTLTVLSYNDIQTAASNPTQMGRLQTALTERKAAHDNPTVVVGGGDEVSPSSLSPVSNWTVPIETLNVIDPAAEGVGNHDLDYGFDAVTNFTAASEFPWLVANIQQEGTDGENIPGTQDYTIVERDGVRIGIVGLVDEAIKGKTAVDFDEQGYEVTDFVDVGSEVATELKTEENVDVVVAAAHIGVPEAKTLATETENIDVVVVGDDEIKYPPQVTDGTVIMEAKARAGFVAEANLTVTDDGVELNSGRLLPVDDRFEPNETVFDIVNESRSKFLSQVAGRTTVPLDSTFASNYAEETAWGNLITDAFIRRSGADVAITNAGGIRGNFVIGPGPITYNDVYTSLPFGNYLVTKEMTGEQLRELLESQATPLTDRFGAQASLQVSGVSYEFVGRPGANETITDVYVEGEPLDESATYNVTINSFMAGWTFGDRYGWNMTDLPTVEEDFTLYGTATVQYIEENSPITRDGDNRIRRVTRSVGPSTVETSGDEATVSFDVPDAVGSIQADTFRAENETTGVVEATGATLSDGTLTVTFDADELSALRAASGNVEVYGVYNDTEYDADRNGFDDSVINGELDDSSSPRVTATVRAPVTG